MDWLLRIVYLVLAVYFVYFVYRPTPIARLLAQTFDARPDRAAAAAVYDGESNVEVERFYDAVANTAQTICRLTRADNLSDTLIVDIPGGAFIVSSSSLEPYKRMRGLRYDVVTINYPVLFEAKARTTIQFLERAIRHAIDRHKQKWRCDTVRVCLVGASAGAYYAVKIINRGAFRGQIVKFIGVCGYYGHASTKNVVLKALDRMYLTSILPDVSYVCQPLPATVRAMLVTATRDVLRDCTESYATTNQALPVVYEGDHMFFWTPGLESARKLYADMVEFIAATSDLGLPLLASDFRQA